MKIAIGMIVRNLLSARPLTDFLNNAEKYGHPIERVIVVYSHQIAPEAVNELQRRTKLSLIQLQNYDRARLILKELGVRYSSVQQLLYCPLVDTHGLIPYGFNRNQVLMEALFTGMDYLVFVDSDVQPYVLRRAPDGVTRFEEIDFIGAHLYGMSLGAAVTSSDYSGYNILPPAFFDGMTDLLWGLHKENMAEFWQSSRSWWTCCTGGQHNRTTAHNKGFGRESGHPHERTADAAAVFLPLLFLQQDAASCQG